MTLSHFTLLVPTEYSMCDYILVPSLKIGGGIQLELDHGRLIQLDNNFVLETLDATVNTTNATEFYKLANHQASENQMADFW